MNSFNPSLSGLKARIPSRTRSAYLCSRLFYKSCPASIRNGIVSSLGRDWPCFCPVCENRVAKFSPLPEFYARQLESHGSDLRFEDFETCNVEAYQCPHCGATDRDRLYALYLAERLPQDESAQPAFGLLDIAPSGPLSAFVRQKYRLYYRTADRFMRNVDDHVDITSLHCYADNSFDAFICSHVLEHVPEDRQAIAELFRVLKPGGWGIAMAPIDVKLSQTREDFTKTSPADRIRYFGQHDHVRVYSREGFIERLEGAGFVVEQLTTEHFRIEAPGRYGLAPSSVLYVVNKPAAQSRPQPKASGAVRRVEPNLAIFGAAPRFYEKLHVGRPNLGEKARLLERVEGILERRWLTNDGPLVQEFEQQIISITGVKHCISMCNATVALEIAIRALELQGEVIVPSYTFVATAHALQWQEITPVFADIDPATLNVDPNAIDRLVTPRTTGIIGVHVWGRPCNTQALEERGRRYGLKVLFDAAHAFGCSHEGRMIGNFGECEVFSFHATKFLNSFEGGAIVTNNDALAEKMRLMRNFGFAGFDRVVYLGINGKMTEIAAAMGLTSLESMEDIVQKNHVNYEEYRTQLRDLAGLTLIDYSSPDKRNYHYIVVEVDESRCALTRDELVEVLQSENVLARKYFWPGCHQMQPYKALFPNAGLLLPNTERLAARMMVLPTGQGVAEEQIREIGQVIRSAITQAGQVRRTLHERAQVSRA